MLFVECPYYDSLPYYYAIAALRAPGRTVRRQASQAGCPRDLPPGQPGFLIQYADYQ